MPDFRPILAIDCDGVIHAYSKGWGDGTLYDPVTDGFWEWAAKAAERFTLVVYSSRSKTSEGRDAMRHWLEGQWSLHCLRRGAAGTTHHEEETLTVASDVDAPVTFAFAAEKPPAWVTIDDRAVRFDGRWDDPAVDPEALRAFKPWMTRTPP